MEVMVGRPNGFTLCVSEKRVALVVGREKCGGVGKESAESGRVCEQDGGEVEVCVEDGGHVAEESQFPQLRVAAAVVRGEENHVHWRVLGVGSVGRGLGVLLTESVTESGLDGGMELLYWLELLSWLKLPCWLK